MITRISTDRVITAVIILLFVAISIVIAISYFQSLQVKKTAGWVSHTQEVLIHSEKILSLTVDNETGSRGYILTGKDNFLEPLKKAQKEIYKEVALLKILTNDNPVQQPRIDSLSFYVDKKIHHTNKQLALYASNGAVAAANLVETGEGKYYSDQVRQIVNKIHATENALLAERKREGERESFSLNAILLSVIVSILVITGLFLIKIRMDFTERKRAAKELEKLNAELESRVERRTYELQQSKDQL